MMGQRETVVASVLRRMILALAVAVLMAAMMVASPMPAGAAQELEDTGGGSIGTAAHVLHCGTLAGGGTNVRNAEAAGNESVYFSCN